MKRSAGILLYNLAAGEPRVLLVHPGGPYWAKKDAGAWSIPKGEYRPDEDPLRAAIRSANADADPCAAEAWDCRASGCGIAGLQAWCDP